MIDISNISIRLCRNQNRWLIAKENVIQKPRFIVNRLITIRNDPNVIFRAKILHRSTTSTTMESVMDGRVIEALMIHSFLQHLP